MIDFANSLVAVHKQRDIVPLDINEEAEDSDEDNEQPVFDFEVFFFIIFPFIKF